MGWKNILIITVGETPPVVTETVWALLNRKDEEGRPEPFIPAKVHLVTTECGRQGFEAHLIGPGKKLEELFGAFGHDPPPVEVNLPVGTGGTQMSDIRTKPENVAYANTVSSLIKSYVNDPETRVHVSLAGGRKTMSYYAGAAIMLFGRDQDELSHVLVNDPILEQCDGFWWPKQPAEWKVGRPSASGTREDKLEQDTHIDAALKAANVELVDVSFVRLRHILTEAAFPGGEVDYAQIVAAVQDSLNAQRVTLVCDERQVRCGKYAVVLPHLQFALYRLVATARRFQWPGAGPDGLGKSHRGWITYDQLLQLDGDALKRFEEYYDAAFRVGTERPGYFMANLRRDLAEIEKLRGGGRARKAAELLDRPRRRFVQALSKLNKLLKEKINNPAIRRRLQIQTEGRDPARFGLLLEPQQIEIQ